jgi:hypothetical protein
MSLTAATVPPTSRAITEGEMAGIISPIRHSDPAEVLSYGFTVPAWASIATRPEARIAALRQNSNGRGRLRARILTSGILRSTRLPCRGDSRRRTRAADRMASIKLSAIALTLPGMMLEPGCTARRVNSNMQRAAAQTTVAPAVASLKRLPALFELQKPAKLKQNDKTATN